MDAASELGRNPIGEHQIQPEYGDEQADAGRDCQTRPSRVQILSRRGRGQEIFIFPVHLTTSRIGNLTLLILLLLHVMTIHIHRPCAELPSASLTTVVGTVAARAWGPRESRTCVVHRIFFSLACFGLVCDPEIRFFALKSRLKNNLNASRPSDHSPVRGKKCQNV